MKQLSIGNVIDGRYRLDDQVGAGGMGIVYRAMDLKLDRIVAIKFLLGAKLDTPFKARFTEEARILARLEHPNILQIFDFGTSDDTPFIVCEFLDGRTIIDHVEMTGPLPLPKIKEWSRQLFSAMSYAHSQGVLHRDLKGENVMVTEQSQIRVMDFGLARREDRKTKLTETGAVMGTATYVSPEVIMGQGATKASDIYSAGVILYEMLVGAPPFEGTTSFDVLQAHLIDIPPDPAILREELPPALSLVVKKTLEKKPDERYKDFTELVEDFTSAIEGKKTFVAKKNRDEKRRSSFFIKKSGTFDPVEKKSRSRSWILILLAPALFFLLAFFIYPLLAPSIMPRNGKAVEKVIGPQSATLCWQTDGRGTVPYALRLDGRQVARGNSRQEGKNQKISLRGLHPGHSYELSIGNEGENFNLGFSTPKAEFIKEPFTVVLNDTFVMDFETNLDRGLCLQITKEDGTILATEKNCPPKGRVIVGDLALGPMVRPLKFQLTLGDEILASGETMSRPQALQAMAYPHGPRSKISNRNARVGPLWVGKYFLFGDIDGSLFCYQLNRTTNQSKKSPTFELCWLMSPSRVNGVLVLHRQLTFAPLDEKHLFVLTYGAHKDMVCRLVDIEARCKEWHRVTGGRSLTVFPEWALDKGDKWNGTVGDKEWIKGLEELSTIYFMRKMIKSDDKLIVQGLKHNNLIVAALAEKGGNFLWQQSLGLAALLKAPYLKENAKKTVFASGSNGIDRGGRYWDYHSRPLLLNNRFYSVLSTGPETRTNRGQFRPACLLSVPIDEKEANKGRVCFRFYVLARRLELTLTKDKKGLLIVEPDNIFEWRPDQKGLPRYLRTSSLFPDGAYGYNSGPVVHIGGKPYFARYQFRTTEQSPDGGLVGNLFSSPHLCTVEEQGNKRYLLRYVPTLVDESDERPGQVIDMVGHGKLLVGQTRRSIFCLDTTGLSWSSYTISNLDRTVGFSIGTGENIGTVQSNGNVTAIPLGAMVARMRGHLRPSMRVPIPEGNDVLR